MRYLLKELLDNPLPFTLESQDLSEYTYRFEVDPKRVYIVMIYATSEHGEHLLKLLNNIDKPGNVYVCHEIHFKLIKKFGRRSRSTTDIEDTGDQFTVFATVLEIMKDYIKRNRDNPVNYWAIISKHEEQSRSKLYEFFARKLSREIPYEYVGKKVLRFEEGVFDCYYVMRT